MITSEAIKLNRKERAFLLPFEDSIWIARDLDGGLYLYFKEPERMKSHWLADWDSCRKLNEKYFEFITWESGKVWSKVELMRLEVI